MNESPNQRRRREFREAMEQMPKAWRTHWCESERCACSGCANGNGKLVQAGYSKDDWVYWMADELERLYATHGQSVEPEVK
jgi:hypothetical protein